MPDEPLPLVLDSDTGTDVDDALAIAYALRHPGIDLRAVTTVAGETRLRALIPAKLTNMAGPPEVEVAASHGGSTSDRAVTYARAVGG